MEKTVKARLIIPYIWDLFRMYLNDPNYNVRESDVLSTKMMNGTKSVRKLINKLKDFIIKNNIDSDVHYVKNMTFKQLLIQINI